MNHEMDSSEMLRTVRTGLVYTGICYYSRHHSDMKGHLHGVDGRRITELQDKGRQGVIPLSLYNLHTGC